MRFAVGDAPGTSDARTGDGSTGRPGARAAAPRERAHFRGDDQLRVAADQRMAETVALASHDEQNLVGIAHDVLASDEPQEQLALGRAHLVLRRDLLGTPEAGTAIAAQALNEADRQVDEPYAGDRCRAGEGRRSSRSQLWVRKRASAVPDPVPGLRSRKRLLCRLPGLARRTARWRAVIFRRLACPARATCDRGEGITAQPLLTITFPPPYDRPPLRCV